MNRWWLKLAHYAWPQMRSWAIVLLLMCLGSGLALLAPWPLKMIVDFVLPNQPLPDSVEWLQHRPGAGSNSGRLAWLAGATVFLFLLRRAVGIAQDYVQTGASRRMM